MLLFQRLEQGPSIELLYLGKPVIYTLSNGGGGPSTKCQTLCRKDAAIFD